MQKMGVVQQEVPSDSSSSVSETEIAAKISGSSPWPPSFLNVLVLNKDDIIVTKTVQEKLEVGYLGKWLHLLQIR